uniref:Zona pellucida sperm-binding protein 3 n=1 Tax=Oncorhynchus tshawytscha TaxID=74940 RepID=A0AAZ3QZJ4_ONCTS
MSLWAKNVVSLWAKNLVSLWESSLWARNLESNLWTKNLVSLWASNLLERSLWAKNVVSLWAKNVVSLWAKNVVSLWAKNVVSLWAKNVVSLWAKNVVSMLESLWAMNLESSLWARSQASSLWARNQASLWVRILVSSLWPKSLRWRPTVSAQCGESVVRVQVNQDLLGIGRLIQPERITLGGCAATEEDAEAHVITFESELHGCGSELTMTEDVLIYTFTLVYEPKPLANTSIVKTSAAMVDIECHYLRNHDVSSNALKPTWIPNISNMVAEELLYFSLRLMTADWQFERPSNHYYLGDIINMEASVMPYHHVPLRVFVDRCVATLAPDVHTVPRYSFIEDHGCLVDAKLTGSSSQFLSRSQDDKIQFQLESFRFQPQNDSQQLYITCHLKASAASSPIDAENKACSFTDGWKAAGGDDLVCGCCDSSCAVSKARDLDSDLGKCQSKPEFYYQFKM